MGEAILAKTVGYRIPDPLDNVNVISGYCSLLVTVRDSGGNKLSNIPVHCKDGSAWYNYNTNDQGMVLFQCNSGSANITAWNYSIIESYNMLDQTPVTANVDAPIATKNHIEMNLAKVSTGTTFTFASSKTNIRFLDTHSLSSVKMIGGGSGGSSYYTKNEYGYSSFYGEWGTWQYRYGGNGGCGGAYNEANNVAIDRSTFYSISIGSGGAGTTSSGTVGGTGGTTSAFGLSAVGGSHNTPGGTGNFKGGQGGIGGKTAGNGENQSNAGGNANYANSSFQYGGGGSAGIGDYTVDGWIGWTYWVYSGMPGIGGGRGGYVIVGWNYSDGTEWGHGYTDGYDGQSASGYGGGGGGGTCVPPNSSSVIKSGSGKSGVVFITI